MLLILTEIIVIERWTRTR